MGADERPIFERAYIASYPSAKTILEEIYDEVSSGNEIRSVNLAGERLKKQPMGTIDQTEMWKTGANVRSVRDEDNIPLDQIINWLSNLNSKIIIEFIDRNDEMVIQLLMI